MVEPPLPGLPASVDISRLRQFLSVVEHGSIGRAAEALRLSQPAVSKSIARLERDLGVTLVDRGQFGAVPTIHGQRLAERARTIIRELGLIRAELTGQSQVGEGHVAVGAGPSMVSNLVAPAVAGLLDQHPALQVTVREALMYEMLDALGGGELDLAIAAFSEPLPDLPITLELLVRDEMVVVARADHPLMDGGPPDLESLLLYPWVLPDGPDWVRRSLFAAFHARRLPQPRTAISTNSAHCMKAMVCVTDALTFLPRPLMQPELRLGLLRPVPMEHRWERRVDIAYRSDRTLSPAARALLDALHRTVALAAGEYGA